MKKVILLVIIVSISLFAQSNKTWCVLLDSSVVDLRINMPDSLCIINENHNTVYNLKRFIWSKEEELDNLSFSCFGNNEIEVTFDEWNLIFGKRTPSWEGNENIIITMTDSLSNTYKDTVNISTINNSEYEYAVDLHLNNFYKYQNYSWHLGGETSTSYDTYEITQMDSIGYHEYYDWKRSDSHGLYGYDRFNGCEYLISPYGSNTDNDYFCINNSTKYLVEFYRFYSYLGVDSLEGVSLGSSRTYASKFGFYYYSEGEGTDYTYTRRLVGAIINGIAYGDTSGINDQTLSVNEYALEQNYPNPFNPITTISYALSHSGQVELSVFNIQGQIVQSLVNEKQDKGVHKAEFDASDLTSGMYIYSLKVDGKPVLSRKMMLLK